MYNVQRLLEYYNIQILNLVFSRRIYYKFIIYFLRDIKKYNTQNNLIYLI